MPDKTVGFLTIKPRISESSDTREPVPLDTQCRGLDLAPQDLLHCKGKDAPPSGVGIGILHELIGGTARCTEGG